MNNKLQAVNCIKPITSRMTAQKLKNCNVNPDLNIIDIVNKIN